MKKVIIFLITIICYSSIQSQPIRFNRMYHDSTTVIGVGNVFNQIIEKNKEFLTFGCYAPNLPSQNYISLKAAKTDSLGNILNWIAFLDTAYNFGLSGWSSDIKTSDGGYIVSGRALKRSNSTYHGFLMKLDSNLNMQWRKYYADTDPNTSWLYRDYAFQSLKITPDNGYIAVGIRYKSGGTSCGLAVKFDSLGNEQWVRTYNLNYYMSGLNTVVVLPDGYILGGAIWTTSDNNSNDNIVTKVDTAGNVLWQKTLGGVKGGEWVILHNFSDTNIMVFQTKSDSAYIDSYGEYMTFPKIHFYKISSVTGNTIWDLSYDSAKYARMCFSFRIFPDGSALACGTQSNNWYPWIIHLNNEGVVDWYKEYSLLKPGIFGNFFLGTFFDLQQTTDKGFVICGRIYNKDTIQGNCGWLMKIDAQGNWQDSATYIMPGVKLQSSIALYPNPASSQLTVNYFSEMEEAVLEIYNTLGVKQMEVKLPQGQSYYSFSISHLAKGYYKAIIKEKGNIRGQQGLVVE